MLCLKNSGLVLLIASRFSRQVPPVVVILSPVIFLRVPISSWLPVIPCAAAQAPAEQEGVLSSHLEVVLTQLLDNVAMLHLCPGEF